MFENLCLTSQNKNSPNQEPNCSTASALNPTTLNAIKMEVGTTKERKSKLQNRLEHAKKNLAHWRSDYTAGFSSKKKRINIKQTPSPAQIYRLETIKKKRVMENSLSWY